ncbi:hypothetical protein [Polymorphospora rubra]|uniref:Uncharacterized protein n=1 Tax=Polymorphospora rubra TaxID=338584 RepID=A0A810N8E4_9ACTN|nr:hypothetical protein [Polymorphospora rubra]BCJ68409.1 hypothetical protein Prubr_54300 [Polymorphospora rubra]
MSSSSTRRTDNGGTPNDHHAPQRHAGSRRHRHRAGYRHNANSGVANGDFGNGCTYTDTLYPKDRTWGSNQEYVEFVTAKANALRVDGRLTAADVDALVAAAVRANVGGRS